MGYLDLWICTFREIGDRQGEGASLGGLGIAYQALGQYHTAIDYHQQDLDIAREIGDRQGEAIKLVFDSCLAEIDAHHQYQQLSDFFSF